jgi:t-SNARE complex subunit (syntaxin)
MIKNTEINMIEIQDFTLESAENKDKSYTSEHNRKIRKVYCYSIIYHIICILVSYVLVILDYS